jgi:DNA-binding NarL/FixJ family response regulator
MLSHRPRILIADNHKLVAELCRMLLEQEFDVIGIVENGRNLVRVAAQLKPDLILAEIALPILNGLDAGEQLKKLLPDVRIVYLTTNSDIGVAAEAFRRGGSGYVLKTCASSELIEAVRESLRGRLYISPTLPKDDINYLRRQDKRLRESDPHLTTRQREVLQLLAEGRIMKEIADILCLSARTVAFHKYRIMNTVGATSNAELVRFAVRRGMVAG